MVAPTISTRLRPIRHCYRIRQGHSDIRIAIAEQQVEDETVERDALQSESSEDRDTDRREEQCQNTGADRSDERLPHAPSLA
jgi:hypothetical protein